MMQTVETNQKLIRTLRIKNHTPPKMLLLVYRVVPGKFGMLRPFMFGL